MCERVRERERWVKVRAERTEKEARNNNKSDEWGKGCQKGTQNRKCLINTRKFPPLSLACRVNKCGRCVRNTVREYNHNTQSLFDNNTGTVRMEIFSLCFFFTRIRIFSVCSLADSPPKYYFSPIRYKMEHSKHLAIPSWV